MRSLTMIAVFALVVGSALPAFANKKDTAVDQQYQSQSSGQFQSNNAGYLDQNQGSLQSAPAGVIRGTVISLDPKANTVTIADYATGADRTFMAKRGELKDLKTGDKVNVMLEKDSQSAAKKIEKNRM
jgi:hypothetical protein